jgi:hypothetical protein
MELHVPARSSAVVHSRSRRSTGRMGLRVCKLGLFLLRRARLPWIAAAAVAAAATPAIPCRSRFHSLTRGAEHFIRCLHLKKGFLAATLVWMRLECSSPPCLTDDCFVGSIRTRYSEDYVSVHGGRGHRRHQ